MSAPRLRIELLGRQHRRLFASFQNRHRELVDYLRKYALRHAETDHLAPAILLARLAVDEEAQGQGVGRYLFEDALARALDIARHIGTRLFVTDAIDSDAIAFYEHLGFESLSDQGFPRRMVLDLRPFLREQR